MRIDVFHDTVCPWCRIGKRHLELALEQWEGEEVDVHFHTFFLNPNIPAEGHPFREYMNAKGGGRVPMEQWFAAPRQAGERVGLKFDFEAIEHAPNSTLSHQLIALTPEDKQNAMMDAVYAAYFEHGKNIGDIDVLVEIAEVQGFDSEDIRARLQAGEAQQDVLQDAHQGRQLGVTGVPFFVFNNRLAFSGAQPPQTILQVMRQATAEAQETSS